jgi:hypothetical protein
MQHAKRASIPMLDQLLDHLVGAAEQRERDGTAIHLTLLLVTMRPTRSGQDRGRGRG